MGNLRSGGLVLAALAVELGEPDLSQGLDSLRRVLDHGADGRARGLGPVEEDAACGEVEDLGFQ